MGVTYCTKIQKKSEPLEPISPKNFQKILKMNKKNLIGKIFELHIIKLESKQGIEDCKIFQKKDLALVLRAKYHRIQEILLALQALIKEIDDILKSPGTRIGIIKGTIKKSENFLSCSENLLKSNVKSILKEEKVVLKTIESEVKNYLKGNSEVQQENEKDFSNFEDQGVIRRTYRKLLRKKLDIN